ncbi:HAD family hydrolase [Neorhizobium sp. P12A]|uniref:HAD family hydrolase n=1 Tax=Neorhizobium sp. P12A TaxID=2268027 RepID=UPI0011EE2B74|nr:HAD-IA family hydrolase [Neorhizobium sp. P12A]KAA0699181.1 HAD family hydrolase [Neorhizobium sp. P12A]
MKALMVDVDGVLVHGRPADGLPYFTYLERDLGLTREMLQQAFFKPYWADIVTGREQIEPRLKSVLDRIAPNITPETLMDYWFENDSRLDRQLLEGLVEYRNKGVTLFLATNQEHRRAAYLMERLGLSEYFDGIFYSAALGHKKPSEDFFRIATERSGYERHEIAFIDDSVENIDAAQRFGWNALHWTSGMTLETANSHFNQPIRL